jgi:WD40 repeat protein
MMYHQHNNSPITSLCFNSLNSLLACSNAKGLISLFSTSDLASQGNDATPQTNYTPEVFVFKQNDQAVHQIEFSSFDKHLLAAAQDDATVTLYDVNQ